MKAVSLRNVAVKSRIKYHIIVKNGGRFSLILAVVYFMIPPDVEGWWC